MNNVFDVNVLGYKLTISTDKDEKYVKQLSSDLNKKLSEIKRGNNSIANMDLLILTALELVDEIIVMRNDMEKAKGGVEKLSRILDEKISCIQREISLFQK